MRKMKLSYCVYVLISLKDKRFYIGYSRNLDQRLLDHGYGKVASTKSKRLLELIYYEYHKNKYDALRRERYFKTSAGKKGLKLMLREKVKKLNKAFDN